MKTQNVCKNNISFLYLQLLFQVSGFSPLTHKHTFFYWYHNVNQDSLWHATFDYSDFTSPSDVQIKIFDQEITIYNPGRLYGNIDIDELKENKYTSELRNKLIAEAFYLTKDIEKSTAENSTYFEIIPR